MKYIFSLIGGSGSTFLAKNIAKNMKVDNKPDTFFVASGDPYTPKFNKKIKLHQFLTNGYSEKPNTSSINGFKSRTGYSLDTNKTIFENLLQYVTLIQKDPNRTVLFNSCAKFEFFSHENIKNVVFLIRHPLYAYLSFSKKERHWSIIKKLGGLNSEKSITYYSKGWISNISEYFKLKNKGIKTHLIRYEFVQSDVEAIPDLAWAFSGWKGKNKKINLLSKESEDFLKNCTCTYFDQLYNGW